MFTTLDGAGLATVKLEQVEPKRFKLLDGFRYRRDGAPTSYNVTPEALGKTDLTSVPFFLRWFVNSYGRHTLPALLHDCLIDGKCATAVTVGADGTPAAPPNRGEADDVFLESLQVQRVPVIRRHFMWAAVSFNTRFSYAGRVARVMMVLWMAMAVVGTVLIAGMAWWGPWLGLLGALGPLPGALLWGRKWRAGLWFGYGVVFLVPSSLLIHVSFLVYSAAERLTPQDRSAGPPSVKNF